MAISFTCRTCGTAYRLPAPPGRELRVRCARCKTIFTVPARAAEPRAPAPEQPRAAGGAGRPGAARETPGGAAGWGPPGSAAPPTTAPRPRPDGAARGAAGPGADVPRPGARVPAPDARPTGLAEPRYELGPLPEDDPAGPEPRWEDFAPAASSQEPGWPPAPPLDPGAQAAPPWDRAPRLAGSGRPAARPEPRLYRRPTPPPSADRRAFLAGLVGVVGLAVAGRLAWGAWRGRDWLAFLRGDPFEVRISRRLPLTGRAGPLYVVEGSVRNLTGSPKGFFEIRGRLVGKNGEPLAETVVYAGTQLPELELKQLSREAMARRLGEARFGDGMANARVEPRQQIPFQLVFVPAPPVAAIGDVEVQVASVKEVP